MTIEDALMIFVALFNSGPTFVVKLWSVWLEIYTIAFLIIFSSRQIHNVQFREPILGETYEKRRVKQLSKMLLDCLLSSELVALMS